MHPNTPTRASTRRTGRSHALANAAAIRRIALLAAATALIAGCASNPPPALPPGSPPIGAAPLACAGMATLTVPASAIGLPTRGARVTSATLVAPGGSGAAALPEYCKVLADIAPVDPAAPAIKLELDLPTQWNRKFLMFGGGGYNGLIRLPPNGNVPAGPADQPYPLGRGYATVVSDSGHQAGPMGALDGSFGVNDEAVRNFSRDALKKTRDVAIALLRQRYAVAGPERAYFAGGSTGGREALAVIQNWPDDWNGAIALYPAGAAASLDLQFGRISQALARPGAYPNAAKRRRLFDAALQACDELDGVKDGIIGATRACHARFDPATAMVDGAPLRCANGAEGGDRCLSDAQIAALKVYDTPIRFGYPVASGETGYPGFNIWGSDLGMDGPLPAQATVTTLALGSEQPASPMPPKAPFGPAFWDQWARFFVTRDPAFNSMTLDPTQPGRWQARISELTALQDINKTDLGAFQSRGGKLLMAHGTNDVLVSTRASEDYFQRLRKTMGADRVDAFVRYYEIPGYGHAVSTTFNAAWDSLTTLENWVERGIAPPPQTVADTLGVPGRTRPLCPYPGYPRYNGSGDVNRAASFSCAQP